MADVVITKKSAVHTHQKLYATNVPLIFCVRKEFKELLKRI